VVDAQKHKSKFWVPVAMFRVLTPLCLWLGIASGGGGHGDYQLAKFLFPLPMLPAFFFGSITWPFIILAVVQYPAYGVILGFANENRRLRPMSWVLLAIHGLLVVASLVSQTGSFSQATRGICGARIFVTARLLHSRLRYK